MCGRRFIVWIVLALLVGVVAALDPFDAGPAQAQQQQKYRTLQRFKPVNTVRRPISQPSRNTSAHRHFFRQNSRSGAKAQHQTGARQSSSGAHRARFGTATKLHGGASRQSNASKQSGASKFSTFRKTGAGRQHATGNASGNRISGKSGAGPANSRRALPFNKGLQANTKTIKASPQPATPSIAAQKLRAFRLQQLQMLQHQRHNAQNRAKAVLPTVGKAGPTSPAGFKPNWKPLPAAHARKGLPSRKPVAAGWAGNIAKGRAHGAASEAGLWKATPAAGRLASRTAGAGKGAAAFSATTTAPGSAAAKVVAAKGYRVGGPLRNGGYKVTSIANRKFGRAFNTARSKLPLPGSAGAKKYPLNSNSYPQVYNSFRSAWGPSVKSVVLPYVVAGALWYMHVQSSPDGYVFAYLPQSSFPDYDGDGGEVVVYDDDAATPQGYPSTSSSAQPQVSAGYGGDSGGYGGGGGDGPTASVTSPDTGPATSPVAGPSGSGDGSEGAAAETASVAPSEAASAAETSEATASSQSASATAAESSEAQNLSAVATLGGFGGAAYEACGPAWRAGRTAGPGHVADDGKPDARESALPPQLVLDTGGHTAQIRALAFVPGGRCLVSGGDDKTIRIWSLTEGRSDRVLRGEIDVGEKGTVYALAVSPDGTLLAAAGAMDAPQLGGNAIRVYDLRSGDIAYLLAGHSETVRGLAFSPDGSQLLSGGDDKTAIVWDLATREPVQVFHGHAGAVVSVAYTPDGQRAVTASLDATARLWSPASEEAVAVLKRHEAPIVAMAVLATDGTIFTASDDGAIEAWDGGDGAHRKSLAHIDFVAGGLAADAESRTLVATCAERCQRKFEQVAMDIDSGAIVARYSGHDGFVVPVATVEGLVATGGGLNHEIHIWQAKSAEKLMELKGGGRTVTATGYYPDSRTFAWSHTFAGDSHLVRGPMELSFDLPDETTRLGQPLPLEAEAAGQFVHSVDEAGERKLKHGRAPGRASSGRRQGAGGGATAGAPGAATVSIVDGDTIEATLTLPGAQGERLAFRTYGFAPSAETVLAGGDAGHLAAYDLRGKIVATFAGHAGTVWTETPSPDGRLLVSGGADQTIKLWNLATGELVVTLFDGSDGEWVMWTPQGYYTGSSGGGQLVGWHVNRGDDQAAEYVNSQQLRDHLNRPDVVERAIVDASARRAVEDLAPKDLNPQTILGLGRPPVLAVLQSDPEASGGRATVVVGLRDNPLPIESVDVWVKDRKIKSEPGEVPAQFQRVAGLTYQALVVPLFGGDNVVRVVATNEVGSSDQGDKALSITIHHEGDGALDKRGTLYILAVGVDKYPGLARRCLGPDGTCDLQYAGRDAEGFSQTAAREMASAHERIDSRVLVNGKDAATAPDKANILAALARIESEAKPNDTVALFFAGHGVNRHGSFYFLPTDVSEAKGQADNSIEWSEVQAAVNRLQGRRLLFLDACHAANSYYQRLLEDAKVSRFVAFAAATGAQFAEEAPEVEHGQFTFALMNGLAGEAEDKAARAVLIYDLASYVSKEVSKRTKGRQTPEFFSTPGDGNFALVKR